MSKYSGQRTSPRDPQHTANPKGSMDRSNRGSDKPAKSNAEQCRATKKGRADRGPDRELRPAEPNMRKTAISDSLLTALGLSAFVVLPQWRPSSWELFVVR
mmetsp:Transcript_49315/g.104908  ORF Transcript_49315/g.104908 Transcript_49315/m.104908 type:complete len:101 (-) Transcript_49315:84-386(-)